MTIRGSRNALHHLNQRKASTWARQYAEVDTAREFIVTDTIVVNLIIKQPTRQTTDPGTEFGSGDWPGSSGACVCLMRVT
jgi:hypothetical protein